MVHGYQTGRRYPKAVGGSVGAGPEGDIGRGLQTLGKVRSDWGMILRLSAFARPWATSTGNTSGASSS